MSNLHLTTRIFGAILMGYQHFVNCQVRAQVLVGALDPELRTHFGNFLSFFSVDKRGAET